MRTYLLFAFCLISFPGCYEDDESNFTKLQNGMYAGTFQRELSRLSNDTAKIILTFSSGTWSGASNKVKYPALCKGTYSIIGDTIIFENECVWTADFDGSLILSGKYRLKTDEYTVEFERDYRSISSDMYADKYLLKRQE